MSTIKILACEKPTQFVYGSAPMPVQKPNHAIIKIKRIGVCGTDLHAFEGTQPFLSYPRVLGHELSGELISFDNAPGFKLNEQVSVIPYMHCGVCIACRKGKTNCCTKMQVLGVHIDGGMAEYLQVPSHCLIHGHDLSLDELALVEPFAVALHGVRRAAVEAGEFVLVAGAGPIGLATMEFARMAGGQVIALEVNEQRMQSCREKLNIDHVLNARDPEILKMISDITAGDMPTVIIDATGNLNSIHNTLKFMAHGARYVLTGIQRDEIHINHPEFHKREATLMSSRNALIEDFVSVVEAIRTKKVSPLKYITHRAKFDAVADEFGGWLNPQNGVVKAMIELHNN